MDTTNTTHDNPQDVEAPDPHGKVLPAAASENAPAPASSPADTTPEDGAPEDPSPGNPNRENETSEASVPHDPAPASSTTGGDIWAARLHTPTAGWVATAVATIIAAIIRMTGLDNVRTLVFDETYYVKDAWSLITLGYEGTWPNNYDASFVAGNVSGLAVKGGYPVHPPTGKWLIGLGMEALGQTDPVGWRIVTAICGVITVFLLCRLAQNLFHSPLLTLLAGLFLATDGIAIVMSRTSILDGYLAMFALAAFLCVVKDQQMSRPTLTSKLTAWDGIGTPRHGWASLRAFVTLRDQHGFAIGPNAGRRPWLLAAGILCGLASSVKWSGVYVLACLGIFVAIREVTYRWRLGHPSPVRGALIADVWWAFILMVPSAILTYIASWFGWFTHPQAHGHGRSGISGFTGALADLWIYHKEMWTFHTGLTTPHTYQSNPYTWLAQVRPTSFHWSNDASITGCASGKCATNVVALGNPVLWWIGIGALLLVLIVTLRYRNWRSGVILAGYLALYVPWLTYAHRTIFTFYTVAFVPFVALGVAWMVALLADAVTISGAAPSSPPPLRSATAGRLLAAALTIAILACAFYFMPLWRGDVVDYEFWRAHMWLPTWI